MFTSKSTSHFLKLPSTSISIQTVYWPWKQMKMSDQSKTHLFLEVDVVRGPRVIRWPWKFTIYEMYRCVFFSDGVNGPHSVHLTRSVLVQYFAQTSNVEFPSILG